MQIVLRGKSAVVTGGAKGIGAATVRLLQEAGAKVEILDLETGCDVTDEEQVRKAFARVGAIDILVNNAGRAVRRTAVEVKKEEWDAVIELNLTALFLCSRLAHPYMKQRGGGAIVNLASIMGLSGGRGADLRAHRPHHADLLEPGDAEDGDGAHAARQAAGAARHRGGDRVSLQRRGALHHRRHAAGGFGLSSAIATLSG
jgi:NAD(P)-dependent dehydrogenase (short-subunit alcohol dehydrogenase family)